MKTPKPKMLKDVKITKPIVTLPVNELVSGGVYLTHTKDLVQIREIDKDNDKMQLFNMTEQCKQWVTIKRHLLVERVR